MQVVSFNTKEKAERCIHSIIETHKKVDWREYHSEIYGTTKYLVFYEKRK